MKKFLAGILILLAHTAVSQTAYYDAIHIESVLDNNTINAKHLKVIAPHFGLDFDEYNDNKDIDALVKIINDSLLKNPFLQDYSISAKQGATRFLDAFSSSGGSGLNATLFADAMARFMIDRAQSELTVAFFDRFQKFVEENDEIKMLFPETCERLENILSVNYRQMLNVLREAFQKDLKNLPEHMIEVVEKIAKEHKLEELTLAVNTLKQVRKLEYLTPAEFMNQLPNITSDISKSKPMWYKNLDASLKMTRIFSNALRDTLSNSNWVSSQDFYHNIIGSETTLNVFLGLIYEQIKKDSISFNGVLVSTKITNNITEIDWYKDEFYEFISLTEEVENSIAQAQKLLDDNEPITNSQIHAYISTTLDIANFGTKIYEHFKGANSANNFETYLSWVSTTNDIYENVYQEHYASAVMESISLFDAIYGELGNERIIEKLKTPDDYLKLNSAGTQVIVASDASLNTKDKQFLQEQVKEVSKSLSDNKKLNINKIVKEILAKLEAAKKPIDKESKWLSKFTSFGVFMANMIDAETAEQAMAVIESVALPVGSSAIKKNSEFSIGVSSYLGGRVAYDADAKKWAPYLYAPIGIDLSYGMRKGGALSLNISVFDIGAVVDYRLSDDSTAIDAKLTWGNILSPGVNVVYGFPWNWPLALGVGAQYGPGLTQLSSDKLVINEPKWKFGVSLAVDIPLMNLYNTPKRKQF